MTPDWSAPPQIKAYTTLRQSSGENLKDLLHCPSEPIWINQVHGNTVILANDQNRHKFADAAYSNQPNQICVVMTADCLPILLCHEKGTHVAAIHAGWRGLAAGIVESTLQALNQPNNELLAWLGPAIGPEKFEVGKDVYTSFLNHDPDAQQAFKPLDTGKWLASLYTLARQRLKRGGVTRISGGQYCTYSHRDLFFSYRREGPQTGRMASLIWIAEE